MLPTPPEQPSSRRLRAIARAVVVSPAHHRPCVCGTAGASSSAAPTFFTAEQVGQHSTAADCWLVIQGHVYDITPFLRSHPGGIPILLPYAGRDATRIFHELHDADVLKEFGRRYRIGVLEGAPPPPPRGAGLRHGGLTPRVARIFVAEDPRGMDWPDGFPKAARWLVARHVPPSLPLPLSLRPLSEADGRSGATGLHVMPPEHWIEPDADCFVSEMSKKRKLLLSERDGNRWYNHVFQAEPDTADEQEELLEVLILNLLTHHADDYSLKGREITVEKSGDVYVIDEWLRPNVDSGGRPIAIQLASLLVQEEFYILRREGKVDGASEFRPPHPGTYPDGDPDTEWSPQKGLPGPAVEEPYRYVFCAGTSCLNFLRNGITGERGEMAPKNAMHEIHAPVPGMAQHGWHRKLGHVFTTLTDETALYRSNFGIDRDNRNTYYLDENDEFQTEQAVLAEYGEGVTSLAEFRKSKKYDSSKPGNAYLTAEFQGITRLPRTHAIVFTLHKYFAPISALKARAPEACAMLHRAFDVTPPDKLAYSLGEDEAWVDALMRYLKESSQGL